MEALHFTSSYIVWHYTRAFRDVTSFWLNIAWFVAHFFSIPLLVKTLFSPWKRMTAEHDARGLEDLAGTIVFNMMSRIVGAFARSILIGMGLATLAIVLAFYLVFMVLWVLLPTISLFSFAGGLSLLLL